MIVMLLFYGLHETVPQEFYRNFRLERKDRLIERRSVYGRQQEL